MRDVKVVKKKRDKLKDKFEKLHLEAKEMTTFRTVREMSAEDKRKYFDLCEERNMTRIQINALEYVLNEDIKLESFIPFEQRRLQRVDMR